MYLCNQVSLTRRKRWKLRLIPWVQGGGIYGLTEEEIKIVESAL